MMMIMRRRIPKKYCDEKKEDMKMKPKVCVSENTVSPSHGTPLFSYHDKHILPQNVTFSTFLDLAGWHRILSYQLVELKIISIFLVYEAALLVLRDWISLIKANANWLNCVRQQNLKSN